MTPREHLNEIVRPNLEDLSDNFGDLRRAFNAAASLDALAAHIYWWARENAPSEVAQFKDDTAYRGHLAALNDSYRLTFEVAKANKHVNLTRGTPSVSKASQVETKSVGWGEGRWGDGRWDGPPQVMITPTGEAPWGAEGVLNRALGFLEEQMAKLGVT